MFTVELHVISDKVHQGSFTKNEELIAYAAVMANAVNLKYLEMQNPRVQYKLVGITRNRCPSKHSLYGHEPLIDALDTSCRDVPVVISPNEQLNSKSRMVAIRYYVSQFEALFMRDVGNAVIRWWQQVSADLWHLQCFDANSGVVAPVSQPAFHPTIASFL
ncbi:hypothetical protein MTO96_050610 [Rhipicephalus appendiculatus]